MKTFPPHLLNAAFIFHCYTTHHKFKNSLYITGVPAGPSALLRVSGWNQGVGRPGSHLLQENPLAHSFRLLAVFNSCGCAGAFPSAAS